MKKWIYQRFLRMSNSLNFRKKFCLIRAAQKSNLMGCIVYNIVGRTAICNYEDSYSLDMLESCGDRAYILLRFIA